MLKFNPKADSLYISGGDFSVILSAGCIVMAVGIFFVHYESLINWNHWLVHKKKIQNHCSQAPMIETALTLFGTIFFSRGKIDLKLKILFLKCKFININFLFIEMLYKSHSVNICISDFLNIWNNNFLTHLMLLKIVTSL